MNNIGWMVVAVRLMRLMWILIHKRGPYQYKQDADGRFRLSECGLSMDGPEVVWLGVAVFGR